MDLLIPITVTYFLFAYWFDSLLLMPRPIRGNNWRKVARCCALLSLPLLVAIKLGLKSNFFTVYAIGIYLGFLLALATIAWHYYRRRDIRLLSEETDQKVSVPEKTLQQHSGKKSNQFGNRYADDQIDHLL